MSDRGPYRNLHDDRDPQSVTDRESEGAAALHVAKVSVDLLEQRVTPIHAQPGSLGRQVQALDPIVRRARIAAVRDRNSQKRMPDTFVAIGRNEPRISAGASGLGSKAWYCGGRLAATRR
jgi:hypothetical protein